MIPVQQTNAGGRGNCMAACWASILEVPIESVPDYRAIEAGGGSWMNAVNTWLSKHHALVYIEIEPHLTPHVQPIGWHLINYGTREGGHSVVGCCGRPVWDPDGRWMHNMSEEPFSYGLLVELTAELRDTWSRTWAECLCPPCIAGES